MKDWKCPSCGSTETGIRNYYKGQAKKTIGFAAEEYCKGCNSSLAFLKRYYSKGGSSKGFLAKFLTSKQTENILKDEGKTELFVSKQREVK